MISWLQTEGELDKNVAMISAEFRKSMNRPACPLATQDLEVNTKNRDHAIAAEHIQYGPLNLNDEEYWERYAKKWNTTADVAKKSNCSTCIAFDISPRMKKCMPGETSDPEGELGYCWMHHFKCHSARTCNTWAAGGPIDLDKVSFDWQERNAQVKNNPPKEPPTLEEFREWVDLVNMKNKELKAFMDSDWFAVSGPGPRTSKGPRNQERTRQFPSNHSNEKETRTPWTEGLHQVRSTNHKAILRTGAQEVDRTGCKRTCR